MKKAKIVSQRVTLLELLDRLLDKGVVAKGEIILSVAEIDLVYLNLGLLLSSVKTVETARRIGGNSGLLTREDEDGDDKDFFKEENPNIQWLPPTQKSVTAGNGQLVKMVPRTNIDPKNVEKGLAKLVLTLIELLRKLMEKQAIRRMEAGFLLAAEVETMGLAFQRLEEKMTNLKQGFKLKDEDLNLDLGPIGELM
jgi:hypothetical protein